MVFGRLCPPSAPSGTGEPPGEGAGGGGGRWWGCYHVRVRSFVRSGDSGDDVIYVDVLRRRRLRSLGVVLRVFRLFFHFFGLGSLGETN